MKDFQGCTTLNLSPIKYVNYIVLLIAFGFEMGAWRIAVKEFATEKGTKGLLEAVRSSKNPTIFTVLFGRYGCDAWSPGCVSGYSAW